MPDTAYIPDDGVKDSLTKLIASGVFWDTCKIRLFDNNITPSDASVIGDFNEATFAGYAAVSIATGSFGIVTVTAHVASASYPTVTFTRSVSGSGVNLYGWWITNSSGTKVYAAARFATAPLVLTNAGDSINLINQFATMQSVN